MEIIRTVTGLGENLAQVRSKGLSIGLVPTMGALHAGHKSLVDRARKDNDIVVVSVFVNPTQFNNPEDLRTYPRTEDADAKLLESCLGPVAEVMEGAMRPGHFNGVAQIVSKLFSIVKPTRAYFGEKDFQQIAVIRRMVELEGFDIDIVDCPIVREPDGLALSSRNVRLSAEARAIAPQIRKILLQSRDLKAQGYSPVETARLTTDAINNIEGLEAEYFQIVDALTMQPIEKWECAGKAGAVGCATVYCGGVRLIDNIRYQ